MDEKQHQMDLTIKALKAAANGLAAGIDNESVNGDQVHALLTTIANQMDAINQSVELSE